MCDAVSASKSPPFPPLVLCIDGGVLEQSEYRCFEEEKAKGS